MSLGRVEEEISRVLVTVIQITVFIDCFMYRKLNLAVLHSLTLFVLLDRGVEEEVSKVLVTDTNKVRKVLKSVFIDCYMYWKLNLTFLHSLTCVTGQRNTRGG